MALKKGSETRFKDMNGVAIRVGDRIQRDDNSIWTVDHRCYAVSTHGIKLSLANIPLERYRIISDGEEATDTVTNAPEDNGGGLKSADPIPDEANAIETEAVDKGIPVEDARKLLALQDYDDEELADELQARGYKGRLVKTKTLNL